MKIMSPCLHRGSDGCLGYTLGEERSKDTVVPPRRIWKAIMNRQDCIPSGGPSKKTFVSVSVLVL